MQLERIVLSVDSRQLLANIEALERTLPTHKMMPIVKANAYGHGAIEICRILDPFSFRYFGLATLSECQQLTFAGIKTPLFLLSQPGLVECPAAYTYTVYSLDFAKHLNTQGERLGILFNVHLKVDVGMNRLGVPLSDAPAFLNTLRTYPFLNCTGIYSHMPCSETPSDSSNLQHINAFKEFHSLDLSLDSHLLNSGGLCHYFDDRYSLVRIGAELYRDVMTVSASVLMIKEVGANQGIGYDYTYFSSHPTRIAVVSCGYADGYSSLLGNKGRVLINGQIYPVVGRICMDMFFVDIGLSDDVFVGSEVVILGKQGQNKISATDLSGLCGLNVREITCLLGNGIRSIKIVS